MRKIKKIVLVGGEEVNVFKTVFVREYKRNYSISCCIVEDRETGKFYRFRENDCYPYYMALECDDLGRLDVGEIINRKMMKPICSVFLFGEFIGYTFGKKDIVIGF